MTTAPPDINTAAFQTVTVAARRNDYTALQGVCSSTGFLLGRGLGGQSVKCVYEYLKSVTVSVGSITQGSCAL